jgi:hypothetical protein
VVREAYLQNSGAEDCWTMAMRAGEFARAWEIADGDLEAIRRSGPAKHRGPRHLQRIWRGEPLADRRVLVRCYHGLGDTIQFARFLSPLRRLARNVTVWCQPALLPLIGPVEGVDRVLPLHEGSPDTDFDIDIEIMEIPHAIRASRDQVEMRRPYLATSNNDTASNLIDRSTLAVGLVWNVGDWDRRRVIPIESLRALGNAGARLYSLQLDADENAIAEIGAIDASTADIAGLADRLQQLDLCICPDTMVAHLSAALGCRTWILLHADCDWRWPACGSETLWYPTARLFRQAIAGDWHGVLSEVRSALDEEIRLHDVDRMSVQGNAESACPAGSTEAWRSKGATLRRPR